MNRRLGLHAGIVLALFLAVSTLLPLAMADHAYSHRYIVFGRVVDAEGNPVPGLTVNLGSSPDPDYRFEPEGGCADQPGTQTDAFGPTRMRPVTNEFGEFTYCFHTHQMSRILPPRVIVAVEGTDFEEEYELNGYTRHSFIPVVLNETREDANKEILSQTYTLQGTAWQAGGRDEHLEGVKVYGFTVDREPVNITFTYNGKEPIQLNTTTNDYGDWAVRVPVEERVSSGTVKVEINGQSWEEDLNAQLGTTYVDSRFEKNSVPVPGVPLVLAFLAAVAFAARGLRRRQP